MNNKRWYYVATVVLYVLVEAENYEEAREKGQDELNKMIDGINPVMTRDIKTLRFATQSEIELSMAHVENMKRFGQKD